MNILLATGIYPPEQGGPATYTRDMARALMERGHRVIVVTYGEVQERTSEREKWTVRYVSRRGGIFLRYLRYTWTILREARATDIIYAQGAVSEGVPVTFVAKLLGKKVVMRVPGDYAWEMGMQTAPEVTESSLDRFLTKHHHGIIGVYERLERWTARSAWSLIAPSQYLSSVIKRWGISGERITVIKNTVQPLPSTEGRTVLRQRLQVDDRIVCFTAVRAVPWKGVGDLIRWWHRIPATHILVVASDGPELVVWKELAQKEKLGDRVRFLGRLDRQAMAEWYDMADVFLLPTGYEGYPHTVPEAISRGVPCLVSDQGGNPETRQEFGDLVSVLPYQERDAWVKAISQVEKRSLSFSSDLSWKHENMVEVVEKQLQHAHQWSEDQPMRIVMVGYERELIKTESSTFERVSSLAKDGLGISCVVLSALPQDVIVERDGLKAQAFRGSPLRRIWLTLCVGVREAKRLPGRTMISAQDPFGAGLVGYLISRWTNHPLELQEHGDFWSGAWVKERFHHRLLSWVGLMLLRRAERVRAVSERVKIHLIAKGIDARKIDVIPVAQSLEKLFNRLLPSSRQNDFTFVAPCRFVSQKGLDTLIEAFACLYAKQPLVRLRLVGTGPLEAWLRREVQERGWSELVQIRPWTVDTDLWDEVGALVVSSRYEGFCRTLTEAMARGVPIVTTDVGCVGSYLRPGVDGLVVPINDPRALAEAMERAILDGEGREQRQRAAQERAHTFLSREELHENQRKGWRAGLAQAWKAVLGPRFELWVVAFVVFLLLTRVASIILFHGQLVHRELGFYTLVDHWFQGYGYTFAQELGCASAYRSPGFLFFLTALYFVFDPAHTWVQAIIQNVFVVAALWLTYAVGKRLVGARAALIGGFLVACYPYTFYHYTQYYHTFLQSFCLLLVVWCLLRLGETRRLKYAVFSGLTVGVLAYVQATILAATPFIAIWLLWRFWPNWRWGFIAVLAIAIFSAGLIAPWTYRNWKAFGSFVPLTTDTGLAIFKSNSENIRLFMARGYPHEIVDVPVVSSTKPGYVQYVLPDDLATMWQAEGVLKPSVYWTQWHPEEPTHATSSCKQLGPLREDVYDRYWRAQASDWIRNNPREFLVLSAEKVKRFWSPGLYPWVKRGAPWSFAGDPVKEWLARTSVFVSMAVVIFLGWFGVILRLRKKDPNAWLVIGIFFAWTMMHILVVPYTKYRIPLDHLLSVYAGLVVVTIWDKIRSSKTGV